MSEKAEQLEVVEPGKLQKRGFGRWLLKKFYWTLFLAGIAAIAYLILSRNEKYALYVNFFEKTPPTLKVISIPPGIGTGPATVHLRLEDKGTGLDEVIIRSDQDGEIRDLLRKSYKEPKFSDDIQLKISGKDSGLGEGDFDLIVLVFDRSFWSNGSRQEIPLKVSYERPRLEVLSAQHNAVIGGSELCFYRVSGLDIEESGVQVGDVEFPGYPARLLDAEFEAAPDVYFAYFAIPLQYKKDRDAVRAFVRNNVGNTSTAPFYYKAQPVRAPRRGREVGALFVEGKLTELADKIESNDAASSDPVKKFSLVINGLRKVTEKKIHEVSKRSELKSSWDGAFQRPAGATLRADFGEIRDYLYGSELLGNFIYTGAEFSSSSGLGISAAAPGKLIYVGDLGLYGKSVIVDHGFGLATVYGYLDSTSAEIDAEVKAGTVLGKAGVSGFSEAPGFLYEVRIHGIPVRPIEWWDARWVHDHIRRKIDDIKKQLNLLPSGPSSDSNRPVEGTEEFE